MKPWVITMIMLLSCSVEAYACRAPRGLSEAEKAVAETVVVATVEKYSTEEISRPNQKLKVYVFQLRVNKVLRGSQTVGLVDVYLFRDAFHEIPREDREAIIFHKQQVEVGFVNDSNIQKHTICTSEENSNLSDQKSTSIFCTSDIPVEYIGGISGKKPWILGRECLRPYMYPY